MAQYLSERELRKRQRDLRRELQVLDDQERISSQLALDKEKLESSVQDGSVRQKKEKKDGSVRHGSVRQENEIRDDSVRHGSVRQEREKRDDSVRHGSGRHEKEKRDGSGRYEKRDSIEWQEKETSDMLEVLADLDRDRVYDTQDMHRERLDEEKELQQRDLHDTRSRATYVRSKREEKNMDRDIDTRFRERLDDDSHSDDSELSDLNTIDEFFHTSILTQQKQLHVSSSVKSHLPISAKTEHELEVEHEIEKMEHTLVKLQEDRLREKTKQINNPLNRTYASSRREKVPDYREHAENKDRQRSTELRLLKQEQDDIRSQSSIYDRESVKLRKLHLEEERRKHKMIDDEKCLKYEFDQKIRYEKELMKKIEFIEQQERNLNKIRNENEELERACADKRRQDEELTKRLKILKEKERLLMEKTSKTANEEIFTPRIGEVDQVTKEVPKKDTQPDMTDIHDVKDKVPKNQYPMFKMGLPKVSDFNGKHFEQWKIEVMCLLQANIYPDYALAQAIRHSLKGDTREVLLTLQPTSCAKDIVRKLIDIYGNIKSGDTIVHDFYSALQKEGELCSAWGVRVEALFQQAMDKGEMEQSKRDAKLKERFWRGLTSEKLKMATRVSYESDDSFETLRRKARREEEEGVGKKTDVIVQVPASVNQQREVGVKDTVLNDLLERLKALETELGKLRNQREDNPPASRWSSRGRYRGGYRGGYRGNRSQQNDQPQQAQAETTNKKEQKPLN